MRTLDDFEGRWTLSRRIDDALSGDVLRFAGEAVFVPDEAGLRYVETGLLHAPGRAPMKGSRVYLWRTAADGVDVFFENGRPFHHIAPGDAPKDHHDCPPDDYRVAYDFGGWPDWQARWRVTGPRKDYVMDSHYSRAG